MSTIYTYKDANIRKTWALFSVFLIVVIGLGWTFSQIYGNASILFFAVIFSSLMSVISYWYSDKIVLMMTKARELQKKDAPELYNIVENLTIAAGLPMPRIYLVEDRSPNAFATGRDQKHAVVAVTSGILDILDRAELEGVLAHELSHIGNRDILVSTIVVVLVGFITLLSDFFLRMSLYGGGRRGNGNAGGALALVGIVLIVLSPIIGMLIQLAVSRKREFLADASGALLTRYPDGLASALEKIARYSGKMQRANHATAHLFIANPFGQSGHVRGVLNRLFSTHPPVEERVRALLGT